MPTQSHQHSLLKVYPLLFYRQQFRSENSKWIPGYSKHSSSINSPKKKNFLQLCNTCQFHMQINIRFISSIHIISSLRFTFQLVFSIVSSSLSNFIIVWQFVNNEMTKISNESETIKDNNLCFYHHVCEFLKT